jgi:hypothetical protein
MGPNPINLDETQEVKKESKLIAAPIEWVL